MSSRPFINCSMVLSIVKLHPSLFFTWKTLFFRLILHSSASFGLTVSFACLLTLFCSVAIPSFMSWGRARSPWVIHFGVQGSLIVSTPLPLLRSELVEKYTEIGQISLKYDLYSDKARECGSGSPNPGSEGHAHPTSGRASPPAETHPVKLRASLPWAFGRWAHSQE